MRKFASHIFNMEILLEDEPETIILKACKKARHKETGGILIGVYSNENQCAQIISVTTPTEDSKQTFNLFVRGTKGILSLLKQRWKEGHYYIGEWHYHPLSSPMPSNLDKSEIVRISKDENTKCPEPVMLIIGGSDQMGWSYYMGVVVNGKLATFEEK